MRNFTRAAFLAWISLFLQDVNSQTKVITSSIYSWLAAHRKSGSELVAVVFAIAITLHLGVSSAASNSFDTVILGGSIVDGSGKAAYSGDIGISDGKIVAIGSLANDEAVLRIDATGKYIVPGFIDVHSHADDQQGSWRGMRSPDNARRAAPAHVSQGITTSVVNSDGLSPFMPLSEQMASVESRGGIGLNLAYMVAHSRIRFSVLGEDSARVASEDEVARMRDLIRIDMDSGAWGLATVLENSDGHWTTTKEFIDMTAALKPYDGVVIAHPRSLAMKPQWWLPSGHSVYPAGVGDDLASEYPLVLSMYEASEELIQVSETNGIRVSISHMAMRGPDPNSDARRMVDAVEAARARGVQIFADMYVNEGNPIGHFSPLLPQWALNTSKRGASFFTRPNAPHRVNDFKKQFNIVWNDTKNQELIRMDIKYVMEYWGGAEKIFITDYPDNSFIGRSLMELAEIYNMSTVDMVIKMGLEGYSDYPGGMAAYGNFRNIENIERFVKTDWVTGDTDGYLTRPFDPGYIHPRFYGAYPLWIRTYVLERKAVSLEHAIRSLSGLAADIVGLKDRGYIREGMAADLSIIDLDSIRPRSTFYNVHVYSDGFQYVFVNGTPVVAEGKVTFALPGEILRRSN